MDGMLNVLITHVEPRPVNCGHWEVLHFWGTTEDPSIAKNLENFLGELKPKLDSICQESKNLNSITREQIFLALNLGHRWVRAKIVSAIGTDQLNVFFIDIGAEHLVNSQQICFLNSLSPSISEDLQRYPALARRFILADVVLPQGQSWSKSIASFVKSHLEKKTWKAVKLGMFNNIPGLRLLNQNNDLCASFLVQNGLAVATESYKEAEKSCSSYKPVIKRVQQQPFVSRLFNVPRFNNDPIIATSKLTPFNKICVI